MVLLAPWRVFHVIFDGSKKIILCKKGELKSLPHMKDSDHQKHKQPCSCVSEFNCIIHHAKSDATTTKKSRKP
jgi:hypothetical protein